MSASSPAKFFHDDIELADLERAGSGKASKASHENTLDVHDVFGFLFILNGGSVDNRVGGKRS